MIDLYPDQAIFVSDIREALKKHRRVIAQAYCGFGKTVVAADIALRTVAKSKRILFAVHRREIRRQTVQTFLREGIPYGVVGRDRNKQVMIGTMPAIRNRLGQIPADLLFIDEGHIYASGFKEVHKYYDEAGAFIVALTATPTRFNGRGMGDYYDHIVTGPSAKWLIDNGRLSGYKLYAPRLVDTSGLHSRNGEYITSETELLMDKATITGDAIDHWKRLANGLRTLVFCASVKHSQDVAEQFAANGIGAAHMDARTPDWERQRIIANFADGRLPVLCNCMLATEGFDLSAQVGREVPIEAVVMLRPTKSLALATQMCGRALRRKDRPAIILDHVGNTDDDKHGLPDQEVEWDLAGKPKRATKKTFACKICYGVFSEHFNVCPSCGAIVGRIEQGKGRPAPEQIDGELVEVDAVERARKRRQYDSQRKYARTLEELKEYGKAKGYKDSWAQHVWDARQNKGRAA